MNTYLYLNINFIINKNYYFDWQRKWNIDIILWKNVNMYEYVYEYMYKYYNCVVYSPFYELVPHFLVQFQLLN